MRWTRGAAAVAVAMALAATGCGGGGSSGGSGDEFVQQANRICAQRQEELDALESPSTNDDYVDLVDQVQPVNEDALKKLKALKPPSDMKDDADELWTMIEAQNVDLTQLQSAARMDDDAGVDKILTKLDERSGEFDTKAEALGLDDCSSSSGASPSGPGTTQAKQSDEQALLTEAKATFKEYIDAYWSVEPEREKAATTMWAEQYAELRQYMLSTAAYDDPKGSEGTLNMDGITGVEDKDGIWILDGEAVATFSDVTYTYTDIMLARNDNGRLAIADYCRTSPQGAGPLEGCLSGSVGRVAQKSTSEDGTVVISLRPMFRTQGTGRSSLLIGVSIDNTAGTTPARIIGGPLQMVMYTAGGDSVTVPSTSADRVDVAPAGGKATGILDLNQPGDMGDPTMPAATLKFGVQRDGLPNYTTGTFEIPSLPMSPADF